MKDDRAYLIHILECIRRIEHHRRAGRRKFLNSTTIQDAVLRNLQTLAESTQRLSEERKALQPQIPWAEIAGFRNVLVHNYLGIDLETIWGIMTDEVAELKIAVQTILEAVEQAK